MSAQGIFGRVLFELSFHGQDKAAAIQHRVSDFARNRLDGVLDGCLATVASDQDVLTFEKVELDLGRIAANELEQGLATRIADCLRDWLSRAMPLRQHPRFVLPLVASRAITEHAPSVPTKQSGLVPLLSTNVDMNSVVLLAFKTPSEWSHLMIALRERQALRKRLANEVSPIVRSKLLQWMAADHTDEVAGFLETFISLHDHSPLVPADPAAFRRALWECVFTELLSIGQAGFSLRLLVDRVLNFMAARYSLNHSSLIENLTTRFNAFRQPAPQVASLIQLLLETRAQTPLTPSAKAPLPWAALQQTSPPAMAETPDVSRASRRLKHLTIFLEWGVLPWAALSGPAHSVESEMLGLVEESPDEVRAFIRRVGLADSVKKRIAGQFTEPLLNQLFYLLSPTNAPWIISYLRQLRRIHAQRPLLAQDDRSFAKILWEISFAYLLGQNRHSVDDRSFIQFLLQQLAARKNISYEALLGDLIFHGEFGLRGAAPGKKTQKPSTLASVLLALLEECTVGIESHVLDLPHSLIGPAVRDLYSDVDLLLYWLAWGALPPWSLPVHVSGVARRIAQLCREFPHQAQPLLNRSRIHSSVPHILSAHLDHADLTAVIKVLAPEQARLMTEYVTLLHESETCNGSRRLHSKAAWEAILSFCFSHPHDLRTRMWVSEVINWLAKRAQSSVREIALSLLTVVEREELVMQPAGELVMAIRNLARPGPQTLDDAPQAGATDDSVTRPKPTASAQIEQWLAHGILPESVSSAEAEDLQRWLESQSDGDWLDALRLCGPKERVIQRILSRSTPLFFARVVRLIARAGAGLILEYLRTLEAVVKQLSPGAEPNSTSRTKKYALAYLLRSVSTSGTRNISVAGLARNTLDTLSLTCQIAPGRLLAALEEKSQPHEGLHNLCRTLSENLEADAPNLKREDIAISLIADTAFTEQDLVLYYLRYGSIPDWASVPSLSALRCVIERFSADQVMAIANAARSLLTTESKAARRVSVLFPDKAFLRFTSYMLPEADFMVEFESALDTVAATLNINIGPLITTVRSRLLEYAARRQANATSGIAIVKTALASILPEIADYLGKSPAVLLHKLRRATRNEDSLTNALAELAHDARFLPPRPSLLETEKEADGAALVEPALASAHSGDTLRQLQHLLQDGGLPEAAMALTHEPFMEIVAQELLQRPDAYIQYLRNAAGRETERKRIARFFPSTLLSRLWLELFPGFKFGAELERLLSIIAIRLSAEEDILIVTAREELLKRVARNAPIISANAVLKDLLASLPAVVAQHTGLPRAIVLIQFQATLEKSNLVPYLQNVPPKQDHIVIGQAVDVRDLEGDKSPALSEIASPIPQIHHHAIMAHAEDMQGYLDTFAYFLRTGSAPWWAKWLAVEPPSQWFSELLKDHSGKVLHVLQSISEKPEGIERLVRLGPPQTLARIVDLACPDYGNFILIYMAAGGRLKDDTALSSTQRSRTAYLHWREVLAFLLDEHAPRLSPAEFLRTMTRRVSQRLGLPLARYAGCLRQVASHCAKADVRYLALADMLFPIQDVAASEEVEQEQIEAATDRTENAEQTEADFVEPLIVSAPKDTLRQLQYLLQYGELPKTANELGQEHFMESVAQDLLHRPDDYRRYLRSAAGRELERKRMARLFPSHLLSKVWPLLLPADHAMAALCLNVLQEAMRQVFPVSLPERWRWIGAEELLRTISQPQSRRWDSAVYLRSVIKRVGEEQSLNSVALLASLRAAARHKRNDIQEKLRSAIDRVERETVAIPAGRANLSGRPAQKTPWVHPEHKARELPAGEPFYIGNAGAVLLWPFLGRYFQMLGLLEKDAFLDKQSQSRAVYLLQYLASGQMEAPEHELLLNKILCGVKTGEPLEHFHVLTEPEHELSKQLLYGVTQNWEKLRNTSILGLRQSFLLREGRLQRKDDAWSLTVSTKTYDALLDSLPWRLSMVRLPWMETILYVKWR